MLARTKLWKVKWSMPVPNIQSGKRAIVAGRTGNGKSTLACFLLSQSPGHWLILNPKWTKAYAELPDAHVIKKFDVKAIERSLTDHRFTLFNPKSEHASVELLDDLVGYFHDNYNNLGLCVDELYTMHRQGQALPGLLGWLTRGRELGQSFLGLTQRPAWISKFLFSESDFIGGMDLSLKDDRKRMVEMTGREAFMDRLDKYRWLWYDVGNDDLKKYGPVPMVLTQNQNDDTRETV